MLRRASSHAAERHERLRTWKWEYKASYRFAAGGAAVAGEAGEERGKGKERSGVDSLTAITKLNSTCPGYVEQEWSYLFLQPSDLLLESFDPAFIPFPLIRSPPALVPTQTPLMFPLLFSCGVQLTFFGVHIVMLRASGDNEIQIIIRDVSCSLFAFPGSRGRNSRTRSSVVR